MTVDWTANRIVLSKTHIYSTCLLSSYYAFNYIIIIEAKKEQQAHFFRRLAQRNRHF